MKKYAALIFGLLLATGIVLPAQAASEVKADMKIMKKSFTAATKANDIATLKTELTALRDTVKKVQTEVPSDFKNQPADSPDRKTYSEGIDKLLNEINSALALADAGKLSEAKDALNKIKELQREYHKKLGV